MSGSDDVPAEILDRLRRICGGLPDAYEEPAWVGVRWRVRTRTFAHVLTIESGRPEAYARAVGSGGPIVVLTFRLPPDELDALASSGHPYFHARWGREVAGMVLDPDPGVDWAEVGELLTESYREMAPHRLAAMLDRPGKQPGA